MPADAVEAVQQIDDALQLYSIIEQKDRHTRRDARGKESTFLDASSEVFAEAISVMRTTLDRLSPEGDKASKVALGDLYASQSTGVLVSKLKLLVGALRGLKRDYLAGRLRGFGEIVRSEVFSDFLEMAEYLIRDEGLKDPAAVLAGGVLEQHIRKLCDKHSVPTTFTDGKGNVVPKKLNAMNQDLAKAGAYGSNDQKMVVGWAAFRNDAAHAQYGNYTADQIKLMIQGIRDFLARNPA